MTTTKHKIYGYTYHADIYCAECGEHLPESDPEGNDKHPIFSWELDSLCYPDDFDGMPVYYSCAICNELANEW